MTDNTNTVNTEEQHLKEKGLRYACTDVGNSERFKAKHGNEVRYIRDTGKWITWDGTRWNSDEVKILDRATQTVRSIYEEARDCGNSNGRNELTNWAKSSQSEGKIKAMLRLASEDMSVSIKDFDTNPIEMNCRDGVVDLKTGKLTNHNPEQMVMKLANV